MPSCVIKRNKEGKITRVLTPSGEVSTLFDKIAGIAAVSDLNKAAEAYMTTYNDRFRSRFGDWVSNAKRGGLRSSLRFRYVSNGRVNMSARAADAINDGMTDIGVDHGLADFIKNNGYGEFDGEYHHVGKKYNKHYFVRLNNGVTLAGVRKSTKSILMIKQ